MGGDHDRTFRPRLDGALGRETQKDARGKRFLTPFICSLREVFEHSTESFLAKEERGKHSFSRFAVPDFRVEQGELVRQDN